MRKILIGIVVLAACGSKGDGKSGKGGVVGARVELKRLSDMAMRDYVKNNDIYPPIDVGPTPAKPCCSQPDHVCKPDPADWSGDWSQLPFEMVQPFKFQYSYKGTGQGFTATAVGDPDCDGHTITITATGTAPIGNPAVTFTEQ